LKTHKAFARMGVLALLLALLAACGDDDSSGTGGASTALAAATRQGTISRASPGPASSRPVGGGPVTGGDPVMSRIATLSWEAPTSNTNGTALTDLSGYRIYYGTNANELNDSVQITNVGIQTYVIENLQPGTWYFAIRAITSAGTESILSDVVAKTIG
jgi:hypothetical protein